MATTKALELAQLADGIDVNANGEITNIGTLSSLDISGDISTSTLSASANVAIADDAVINIGSGNDLRLYHRSSDGHSFIDEVGSGSLYIRAEDRINFRNRDGSVTTANFIASAGVELYYAGDKKLETSNTGISVVGDVNANTLTTSGNASVGNDLTVAGNLTVSGNTTFVNTDNLQIEDLNITLASGAANSAVADGAGITIDGANATLTYDAGGDRWKLNRSLYTTAAGNNLLILESVSGGSGVQFNTGGGTLNSYIRGGIGGTANLRFKTNGDNDRLIIQDNGDIQFYEDNGGTPQVGMHWDYVDGRLGIGTDAPSNRLDVEIQTTDGIQGSVLNSDPIADFANKGSNGAIRGLQIGAPTGSVSGPIYLKVTGTSNRFAIVDQSNSENFTILDNGNVGIDTDVPSHKLDVAGDINAQSSFRTDEVRHNVRPSLLLDFANSKRLNSKVEHSRSTTATYYDGKARALAEENTKKYSENFVNGYWNTKLYTTAVGNTATAPNGLLAADELVEDNTNNAHYIHSPNSASELTGPHTYSVYAKANTRSVLGLWSTTVGHGIAYFDLSNGTHSITTGVRVGSASMQDVGNGWYRCSFSTPTDYVVQSSEYPVISMHNAVGTYSYQGDGSSSIYIWGAQLENRTTPSAYTATFANPVKNYQNILTTAAVNEERFDHYMGSGESRGLLIEQQSTNYNINSEALTNWGYSLNVTYQADVGIAPDGTKTADLVYGNTTSGQHYFGIPSAFSQGTGQETFSVFLKPFGNVYKLRLYLANQAGPYSQVFDFANGTMSTSGSGNLGQTMEDCGNGWWRCSFSWTATKTNPYPTFAFLDESDAVSFSMDGYSGVLVWGAQWENGKTYPSSYIKTTGSSVTRAGDYAKVNQLFDFFNTNEGTFFVDQEFPMQFSTDANTRYMLSINGSSFLVMYKNSNSASINTYDGITGANRTPTTPGRNQIAVGYSRSQLLKNITINGSASENALDGLAWGNTFETHQQLTFGQATNNHGWIRKIAYYPKYLSTTATKALTEE